MVLNVLGVGDALLPKKYFQDALVPLADRGAVTELTSYGEDDEKELDKKARILEIHGPTADSPPELVKRRIGEIEILMIHYCPVSRDLLQEAKNLKILATCRYGTENIDLAAATELGILAFHVIGRTTETVSDFTVGLLLSEIRNIARADKFMKSGVWQKEYSNSATTPELENKTVGIVGFGEIGRAVRRKLSGFNVKFMAYDPFVPDSDIEALGARPAKLEELLSQSDFVTLHAKLSGDAKHMIGKKELDLMKPTAYLINSARADLVDEQALAAALAEKRISGAALDVYSEEPLPADHPFMKLDNITMTPHLASSTLECLAKSPRLLVTEILKFIETGESRFILNPEVLEKRPVEEFRAMFNL